MLDPCLGGHMMKSWLSHNSRLGSSAQFSWYLHKISCKICQLVRGGGGDLQIIPYPTAFPYGNGMVLHFYQQQESSTTKTVHKVINKGLKTYV